LDVQSGLNEDKIKFFTIQKELSDQKSIASIELIKNENSQVNSRKQENTIISGVNDQIISNKTIIRNILDYFKINKPISRYVVMILVLLFALGLIILLKQIPLVNKTKKNIDCPECLEYYQNFERYLNQGELNLAWNELTKLQGENKDIASQQSSLINKVKEEVKNLRAGKTESDLRNAKNLLVESMKYGNMEIKQDTLDISESIRLLQAQNAFSENPPKYEFSKKLLTIILDSECSIIIKNQAEELLTEVEAKMKETEKRVSMARNNNNSASSAQQLSLGKIYIVINKSNGDFENLKPVNENEKFKVGDKLVIIAKQGNSYATNEKWIIKGNKEGIIEVNDLNSNPLKVELKKIGQVKLSYKDQGCTLNIRR
jgi:hypothetical protein